MKTNKTQTKCLEKVGHLRLRFGHLRQTDTSFAENNGFVMTVWQLNWFFNGFFVHNTTRLRSGIGRPTASATVAPPSWRLNAGWKPALHLKLG
jgi:hypothetical protein